MLNDNSSIKDLAIALSNLGSSIKIRPQRFRGEDRFLASATYPGGAIMLSSASLAGVLDNTIAFLRLHEADGAPVEEIVEADPNGAHIGPAPRPDPTGTSVGYPVAPSIHCAVCGFGETAGEVYLVDSACTNCGAVGRTCTIEPGHECNHDLQEDSGENRVST
jgi:hypothetical protein